MSRNEILQEPARRGVAIFVAAMLALVLVAVAFIVGRVTATSDPPPSNTSAEAGFARDMQTHHAQAVEMSMIVRDLTDDPDIRLLAYDIGTSQSQQAGHMYGWLSVWGLPQSSDQPPMSWMSTPVPGGPAHAVHADGGGSAEAPDPDALMPGMATRAQLDELRGLTGVPAEKLFLQLMIAHHQGGVEMAEAVLARSSNPVVTNLANSIVQAQQSEIGLMQDLLAARQ